MIWAAVVLLVLWNLALTVAVLFVGMAFDSSLRAIVNLKSKILDKKDTW